MHKLQNLFRVAIETPLNAPGASKLDAAVVDASEWRRVQVILKERER